MAVVAEDVGSGAVEFESIGHNHLCHLNVEAVVSHLGNRHLTVRTEVVQRPAITFALEPKTPVFHSCGRGKQMIVHSRHRHAVGKSSRIKYVEAVRQAKRGVAWRLANRALAFLRAVSVGKIESRSSLCVAFIVSKGAARAELSGCRQPSDSEASGKVPVKFGRWNIEIAVIVADHPPVLKPRKQVPLREHTLREVRTEELVRHHTIIRFPIWVRA